MNKDKAKNKFSIEKEERKMAVSKATLLCVKSDIAERLVKDIKNTKINMATLKTCDSLIEKLEKGELLNKNESI